MRPILKAHAYGNDFVLMEAGAVGHVGAPVLARAICERHRGVGADGLILYRRTAEGAEMRLLNADGSPSEVSGNGVRCLAAMLAQERDTPPGSSSRPLTIHTEAGDKVLTLLSVEDARYVFRAAMGHPEHIRTLRLDAGGETVDVIALTMGNPQCVAIGPLDHERLHRLGPALSKHAAFPAGANVELAAVEAPDRVRILIWERGVGPTESSGTGSCAAAVAAVTFAGAARVVDVVAPGGSQRVEWTDAGVFLTGWAELLFDGAWLPR